MDMISRSRDIPRKLVHPADTDFVIPAINSTHNPHGPSYNPHPSSYTHIPRHQLHLTRAPDCCAVAPIWPIPIHAYHLCKPGGLADRAAAPDRTHWCAVPDDRLDIAAAAQSTPAHCSLDIHEGEVGVKRYMQRHFDDHGPYLLI